MTNRLLYLYRDPRRTQSKRFILSVVFLQLLLLVPLMWFLNSDWVREHIYDTSDSVMNEFLSGVPVGVVVILASIVAPLWEEAVFRWWMNLKAWTIVIFTVGSTGLFCYQINPIIGVLVGLTVLILSTSYINRIRHHMDIHFRWWFYGSIVLFGLMHIANHQWRWEAVIFTLPQMIIGMSIGFVRIHFGMIYGVLFHALWNGMATMMMLLPYFEAPKSIETEQVSIQWEPGDMMKWSSSAYYSDDSVYASNVRVEVLLRRLYQRVDPDAVVEFKGSSFVRVKFQSVGPIEDVLDTLVASWSDQYSIDIVDGVSTEQVLTFYNESECEPKAIPGEIVQTRSLGLYDQIPNGNELALRLQNKYAVKLNGSHLEAMDYDVVFPTEGVDSALSALKVYNCIEVVESEEPVRRVVLHLPQ